MTPLKKVYSAFLAKMLDDEYGAWTIEEITQDLNQLLKAAIVWFKFPRVSLEFTIDEDGDECFVNDLDNEEIQIIATYMKCEWLNRSILTWEHIKAQYTERDFSEANLLDKLCATLEMEKKNALRLESLYYRSIKGKPFRYRRLAGYNDD